VQGILLLISGSVIKGAIARAMNAAGAQMMAFGEGGAAPRAVRINGVPMQLRVQTIHGHSARALMDRFAARCRQHNGRMFEELLKAEQSTFTSDSISSAR